MVYTDFQQFSLYSYIMSFLPQKFCCLWYLSIVILSDDTLLLTDNNVDGVASYVCFNICIYYCSVPVNSYNY